MCTRDSSAVWHLQSGKSTVLNNLLTSVVKDDPVFGVGGPRELLICQLDLATLSTAQVRDGWCMLGYISLCMVRCIYLSKCVQLTSAYQHSFADKVLQKKRKLNIIIPFMQIIFRTLV